MACKYNESLDTSVILRVILKDSLEYGLRVQDLLMRQGVVYHVSDLAVTEAVYVLQGEKIPRDKIVEGIRMIFELPRIVANFNLFERVFPMYLAHPKLSFNDCCLAVYAELNGAQPLWTFDRKLVRQVPTAKAVA